MIKTLTSKIKNFSFLLVIVMLLAAGFTSCDSVLDDIEETVQTEQTSQNKNKGVVKFKFTQSQTASRTISPYINVTNLTDITLTGSNGTDTYNEQFTTAAQMEAATIEVEPGDWSFTITADNDGYTFTDTKTLTVEFNSSYNISFQLSTSATTGKINLRLSFPQAPDKITREVQSYPSGNPIGGPAAVVSYIEATPNNYVDFNQNSYTPGTYRIIYNFYMNDPSGSSILINTYSEIINVRAGFLSKGQRTIDLNNMYTITYAPDGGIPVSAANTGLPEYYSIRSSSVTLSSLQKEGYDFQGWFTGTNGTGTQITALPDLSPASRTLYAYFTIHTYTIEYNNVTGVTFPDGTNPTSYTINDAVTLKAPAKLNYTFKGWWTEDEGVAGGMQKTGFTAGETGNKVYYAHWEINPTIQITPGFPGTHICNYVVTETATGKHININLIDKATDTSVTCSTLNVYTFVDGVQIGSSHNSLEFDYPNYLPEPNNSTFRVQFSVLVDTNKYYSYDYYPSRIYVGNKMPGAALNVGDIVFMDGTAMSYSDFAALTTAEKNAKKPYAVAVIFYKGTGLNNYGNTTTTRTLGIGLKQACSNSSLGLSWNIGTSWCTSNADAYQRTIETVQCTIIENNTFTGNINGKDNFAKIAAFDGVNDADTDIESKYPLFHAAKTYGTNFNIYGQYQNGWYIPTAAEMYQIYLKYTAATNSLKDILTILDADLFVEEVPGQPGVYMYYALSNQAPSPSQFSWRFQWGVYVYPNGSKDSDLPACFIHEF